MDSINGLCVNVRNMYSGLFTGSPFLQDITSLAVDNKYVYAANGESIQAFKRKGREVRNRSYKFRSVKILQPITELHNLFQLAFTYNGHKSEIIRLLPFGFHLISVDKKGCVKVWDTEAEGEFSFSNLEMCRERLVSVLMFFVVTFVEVFAELSFDANVFRVSVVMHPTTYANKILFASQQGSMQLWNIRRSELIYSFKGWNSPITCVEQVLLCFKGR